MSASKQKGTLAESAFVNYAQGEGFPHAERRVLYGAKDRGDVAGIIGFVGEVKNCATLDLAGWCRELEREMANDGAPFGAVVHKRRGKGDPADWYATMPVHVLMALLRAALDVEMPA